MITKQLIDRIEGEANLYFETNEKGIDFATIAFPHFRGMESILEGKPALDALVITPRVCGICGHSHLLASVRAIEDAYANAGFGVKLSQKASDIRELTLVLEIIQNHFKWIYLVLLPELTKLTKLDRESYPLKGAFAASIATRALALFAGQWPHSSYMLPGGITSDPSHVERLQAQSHIEELIAFFEKECIGGTLETFLEYNSCSDFTTNDGEISYIHQALLNASMQTKGMAYDRFMVLGEHRFSKPSKLKQTRHFGVDAKYVSLQEAYSPLEKSYAKNACYKDLFYESGPLARAMALSDPLVKSMHRRYKDSCYSRVMARVVELGRLLAHTKELVSSLTLDEPSYNQPVDINKISSTGVGIVEAPRGPLIHRVNIDMGVITHYEIITPTQWNIGSSIKSNPTPAQKAMIGELSTDEARFIFRSFDVCSVCTTH